MTLTKHDCRVASTSCGDPLDAIHVDEHGATARYYEWRLERKRRWNVGLRKYANELTGRIELIHPQTGSYRVVRDWNEAIQVALEWHASLEKRLGA